MDRPFVVLPAVVEKRHKRSVDKANTMISSDRAISTSCVERVLRRTLPRSTGCSRLVSNDSYDETDVIDVGRRTIFEEKAAATVEACATYIEETPRR